MDNQTQNEASEYMKKLPQAVQDFVYDRAWEVRTNEIAGKYSLSPEQTDSLANIVVLVLIGLESPETFLETVVADLGISRLLAEQIMADLEKRVFEYAIKEIESKNGENKNLSKTTFDVQFPAAKNPNLPMVEKGEVAHDSKIESGSKDGEVRMTPKPTSRIATGPLILNPIGPVKASASEPVQRPVPVPRFIPNITESPSTHQGKPIMNSAVETTPKIPVSIMDSKLNAVVRGASEVPAQAIKPVPTGPKPPEKYTADPYREPLS